MRVDRHDDGAAIGTTAALDADARDETLLCCLRQAQAPVGWALRPGGAVRFVLAFAADPAQLHVTLERTATSRRSGGPEALAIVQSAFRE